MNQNWALIKSWRMHFSFYWEHKLWKSKLNFTSFYKEMLEVSPVGVETKLRSLHDVGCHPFNDWTVIPCSKTLHAVDQALNGLWVFLIHLLLCHPPKMKIQWIQIRGVSWPDDGHASTDHSILELLNKKILCQTGAVRRGVILHPPVTFPRGLVSECWPYHLF